MMTRIRLLQSFTVHHQIFPAGLVLDLSDQELARRLVMAGIAAYVRGEHPVLMPRETRDVPLPGVQDFPIEKKKRGRPKKVVNVQEESSS